MDALRSFQVVHPRGMLTEHQILHFTSSFQQREDAIWDSVATTIHNVTNLQSTCSNLSWGHFYTLHSLRSEAYKETYMDVECLLTACNKQIVAAVEDLPMRDWFFWTHATCLQMSNLTFNVKQPQSQYWIPEKTKSSSCPSLLIHTTTIDQKSAKSLH